MEEIDKLLRVEANSYNQEAELKRILEAPAENPLEVLGLASIDIYCKLELPELKQIKNQFRKRSLLVHPDKNPDPKASDAFEKLKKAQQELEDEARQVELMEEMRDARNAYLKDLDDKLIFDPITIRELLQKTFLNQTEESTSILEKVRQVFIRENQLSEALLQKLQDKEDAVDCIRAKMKTIKKEALARERLRQLNEFGRQREEEDRIKNERKRKAEYQKQWEADRQARIQNWQSFQKATEKKKSKKKKEPVLLG